MPENSQKGHLRPKNLKFKLVHFQTVGWDAIAITAGMLYRGQGRPQKIFPGCSVVKLGISLAPKMRFYAVTV